MIPWEMRRCFFTHKYHLITGSTSEIEALRLLFMSVYADFGVLHLSFFLFLTFQSLPRRQITLTQKAYYLKSTLNIHVFTIYINLYYIYKNTLT